MWFPHAFFKWEKNEGENRQVCFPSGWRFAPGWGSYWRVLCIAYLGRCCQRLTMACSPRSAHSLWTPLPLGMTFPALSTHPPVASGRGAARGTVCVFMPSCVPFLFVLKAKRGECCGSTTFKQNQLQQREENYTPERISRSATSLGFCSNRRMILEAFSKGIKPGFISLLLPIVMFFPSLHWWLGRFISNVNRPNFVRCCTALNINRSWRITKLKVRIGFREDILAWSN